MFELRKIYNMDCLVGRSKDLNVAIKMREDAENDYK